MEKRAGQKFISEVEEFKSDLRHGYDAIGKDGLSKKVNAENELFISDQVSRYK